MRVSLGRGAVPKTKPRILRRRPPLQIRSCSGKPRSARPSALTKSVAMVSDAPSAAAHDALPISNRAFPDADVLAVEHDAVPVAAVQIRAAFVAVGFTGEDRRVAPDARRAAALPAVAAN